jgi:hypothetical protein
MIHRLPAVAIVAVLVAAVSAPADACPSRSSWFTPVPGSVLEEGEAITIEHRGVGTLRGALFLKSSTDVVPLRVESDAGRRVRLVPAGPLAIGQRYHLVTESAAHALGRQPIWWIAGERDLRADLQAGAARLALFGLLPFAFGYAAVRKIIIRRRRRIIRDL